MIAGLPLDSWLLIAAAVGPGLLLELVYFRRHRPAGRRSDPAERDAEGEGRRP